MLEDRFVNINIALPQAINYQEALGHDQILLSRDIRVWRATQLRNMDYGGRW